MITEVKYIILLSMLLVLNEIVYSQLIFSDNFDNGRIDSATLISGNLYSISPATTLYFRITGALGQTPQFRVYQGTDYIFRNAHRMVYRYNSQSNWTFFDTGYVNPSYYYFFYNKTQFLQDTVFIAYWFPWTYTQMSNYMNQIHGNNYVKKDYPRGYSAQNRAVYGFEVTDTTYPLSGKTHIVIVSRQHIYESIGSHISRGMSNYLIHGTDSFAVNLRKKTVFHFYPMVDPDGVYNASRIGHDMNRSWYWDTTPSPNSEINILRKAILQETNRNALFAFDIHSHGGYAGDYYYWGFKTGPSPYPQYAINLVRKIRKNDSLFNSGNSIISGNINGDVWTQDTTIGLADWWFYSSLKAVSFALEPGSVPVQTQDRIEKVGVSICRGIYEMLFLVTPVNTISTVIPAKYSLHQNFPNPFNNTSKFKFEISKLGHVKILVSDVMGRVVKTIINESLQPGIYETTFDGSELSSGVYFYQMISGNYSETKKLILLK